MRILLPAALVALIVSVELIAQGPAPGAAPPEPQIVWSPKAAARQIGRRRIAPTKSCWNCSQSTRGRRSGAGSISNLLHDGDSRRSILTAARGEHRQGRQDVPVEHHTGPDARCLGYSERQRGIVSVTSCPVRPVANPQRRRSQRLQTRFALFAPHAANRSPTQVPPGEPPHGLRSDEPERSPCHTAVASPWCAVEPTLQRCRRHFRGSRPVLQELLVLQVRALTGGQVTIEFFHVFEDRHAR